MYSLPAAIKRVAATIPHNLMMTRAAEEARLLARQYADKGATELTILAALVAAVLARPPDGPVVDPFDGGNVLSADDAPPEPAG